MINKPMLAASVEDLSALRFPLLASPKLDGIRCVIRGGEVLSRSLKPIRNEYIRHYLVYDFQGPGLPRILEGCDGEIMLAKRGATFQDVSSAVMSRDGDPSFVYWVFDCVHPSGTFESFESRLRQASKKVTRAKARGLPVRIVPHQMVNSVEDLSLFETKMLARGYEGVMLRDPVGPYKSGRSTLKEGYLMKLKRFVDAEAVIVGFEEQEANENEAKPDELGRAKRSTHKAGRRGKGTLGAFVVHPLSCVDCCRQEGTGTCSSEFRIGGGRGLTAALRQEIWDHQSRYIGKTIKFYYQSQGTKDAPRIPQFDGFRDASDL